MVSPELRFGFALIWHKEVGISRKNKTNTGAISDNGRGKALGLRLVALLD